jgi:pilus assembly protein Flp/PilA
MEKLMMGVKQFIADEEGVTMVEYGLIAALISIVALVALTGVGKGVHAAFLSICGSLQTAIPGSALGCA